MRSTTRLCIVFATITLASAAALADPPSSAPPTQRSAPVAELPRAIYRFEFSVRRSDDPAGSRPLTYSMAAEENHPASVSVGTNIALASPASGSPGAASQRMDVGLMLHFSFTTRGSTIVLTCATEMSSPEAIAGGATIIHRMRADGEIAIAPGHPAAFTSVTDITTRRTYEISATATRVL